MGTLITTAEKISNCFPEFNKAHWLLRIPLSVVFIQQGLDKLPVSIEDADSYGLPYIIWLFVAWSELFSGIGLLLGGLINRHWFGDAITRFSGIIIVGIVSGIIFISKPGNLLDVLLYDNLHVFLYLLGLFFALRGNKIS